MLSLWYQATVQGTGLAPLAVEGNDIMHSFKKYAKMQLVVQIKSEKNMQCVLLHLRDLFLTLL